MQRLALAALLTLVAGPAFAEYSFEVGNNTGSDITAIEVSEDGVSWGKFDIGEGIAAGESASLVWAEHTDDSGCEWQFRATFDDGSVSEPVPFDFCEENLELSFD
jgi:hypothetical protein